MEKVQIMSEKTTTKNIKLISGNAPVHGVWRFQILLYGLWKMQKNQKSEFYFDYGQNVF